MNLSIRNRMISLRRPIRYWNKHFNELIWGNESNSKYYLTRNRFVMSGIECKVFPEKKKRPTKTAIILFPLLMLSGGICRIFSNDLLVYYSTWLRNVSVFFAVPSSLSLSLSGREPKKYEERWHFEVMKLLSFENLFIDEKIWIHSIWTFAKHMINDHHIHHHHHHHHCGWIFRIHQNGPGQFIYVFN